MMELARHDRPRSVVILGIDGGGRSDQDGGGQTVKKHLAKHRVSLLGCVDAGKIIRPGLNPP
jgi:hypothetical protein